MHRLRELLDREKVEGKGVRKKEGRARRKLLGGKYTAALLGSWDYRKSRFETRVTRISSRETRWRSWSRVRLASARNSRFPRETEPPSSPPGWKNLWPRALAKLLKHRLRQLASKGKGFPFGETVPSLDRYWRNEGIF